MFIKLPCGDSHIHVRPEDVETTTRYTNSETFIWTKSGKEWLILLPESEVLRIVNEAKNPVSQFDGNVTTAEPVVTNPNDYPDSTRIFILDSERHQAVILLRNLAQYLGDPDANKFPDDLHIADIISKHIEPYLHPKEPAPQKFKRGEDEQFSVKLSIDDHEPTVIHPNEPESPDLAPNIPNAGLADWPPEICEQVFKKAHTIFNHWEAYKWMNTPQHRLGGKIPLHCHPASVLKILNIIS